MAAKKNGVTWVALLRGINVGGKNPLAMKDLVAKFEAAGCANVRTYINSGNVLFSASPTLAKGIPATVSKKIRDKFGLQVPIVLRTADELVAVTKDNPLLEEGAAIDNLFVGFLAEKPTAKAIAALDPSRSPPDHFLIRDREIFLTLPNGAARTKLTNAWFDSKLRTVSTMRNWRTVLKLAELAKP